MRTAFISAGRMSSGLSRNGSAGVRRVRVMGRGFIPCVMRRRCSLASNSRRHLTRRCVTDSLRNRPRGNIQDGGIPNDFSSWTVFGSFGIGSEVLITFAALLRERGRICYNMRRWTSRATCESAYTNRAQIRKDDGHGGSGKPGCASRVRGNIQDKLSGRMSQRMSGPLLSGNRLIESL